MVSKEGVEGIEKLYLGLFRVLGEIVIPSS